MNYQALTEQIQKKRSFLCIGLDSDFKKIPPHLENADDPVFAFNKEIVKATAEYAVAYKPNVAFYESHGSAGFNTLEKTVKFIRNNYPDIFLIADAKRGDIGNTSRLYAKAFLENMPFDAITVNPYMGQDSVGPFLEYQEKWVILLALTSNLGADDFQYISDSDFSLFEHVLTKSQKWAGKEQMMYVVGATRAEMLKDIRKHVPDHFLLVPGVGAQGGSLEEVAKYGMNSACGLLVNSSRGIIFASNDEDFAGAAAKKAAALQEKMAALLDQYGL